MGKNSNAASSEAATSNEVVETAVVEAEVVEVPAEANQDEAGIANEAEVVEVPAEANQDEAGIANEAEVIASNIFVAEDGTQVEFAVQHFIFGKRKYTVEEAVAEIPEGLQELYERKSFIFKKV